jgi:hypothetical protein
MRYELLVDGERRHRAASEEEARIWLRSYRAEHREDDPDAVHVQVRRLTALSWLTGGRLVDRDLLMSGGGPRAADPT